MTEDPLFTYVAATGICYCDRTRTGDGDYARIGFLPFSTLEADIAEDCPDALRDRIVASMAAIQARRGEDYQISTAGQTVRLGWASPLAA